MAVPINSKWLTVNVYYELTAWGNTIKLCFRNHENIFAAIVLWDCQTCFSRNSYFRWAITVLVMLQLQIFKIFFHILRIHRWTQLLSLRLCMIGCHCRISKIASTKLLNKIFVPLMFRSSFELFKCLVLMMFLWSL